MEHFSNKEGKWIAGKNYRKKILLKGIKGKVNLIEDVIIESFGNIPLHKHQFTDEIFYIIKGDPTLEIEDKAIQLEQGDMIIIEKGESHGFSNRNEAEIKLICLKINYKEGDSYLG